MDSTELAEYLTDRSGDAYSETLICDFGTDRGVWWACNMCGRDIEPGHGCPDHAPLDTPGLTRVECTSTPPHPPMWVLAGDHTDYCNPCPQCLYDQLAADHAKATKTDRCYHWPWRRWRITRRLTRLGYTLGVFSSGGGYGFDRDHDGCMFMLPSLRGRRPYVLFAHRETWRCWLIGRHRRGEEVGFGFCGKCVPWQCCGSQRADHAEGCVEDVAAVVS